MKALKCRECGREYPLAATHVCEFDFGPLEVAYDYAEIKSALTRSVIESRPQTMWRYRELLPIENDSDIVSLGETMTPLLRCERLAKHLGMSAGGEILIKDESRLPTGSFKSRGMAMAVSMAKALGVKSVAAPTAGNAGGALAAYAAKAGLGCFIFMPQDTPIVNQREAALFGAHAFLVNGLISDCGRLVREGAATMNWFDMSTLREPYRIEGKKTMGLELVEQLAWTLPDVILYPTGGGTGLIGMWKAFAELETIGWLQQSNSKSQISDLKSHKPRMFACQSDGCAPIVCAFDAGERFAKPFENAHTIASGLRVPGALGDFMILDAVRESGGRAMEADESRLVDWMNRAASLEGISLCPETAACLDVLERALREDHISRDEQIVIFNTGAAQKYVEAMAAVDLPRLDCTKPIDWTALRVS